MTASRWLGAALWMASMAVGCGDDAEAPPEEDAGNPPVDAGQGNEDGGIEQELLSCSGGTLAAGDHTLTLSHAGAERKFLLHVPASYDGEKLLPLVLDIHGLGGSAEYQKTTSGWLAKSDEQGFLLAHPQGLSNSWNAGELCCGQSLADKVDDEGFMRALVEKVKAEACVNPRRVYATGLSNGGAMAHRLACNAADMFAAVAPVSMSNSTTPCEPARGISVSMFRATADELVPYEMKEGNRLASAKDDLESWRTRNACGTSAKTSHGVCEVYESCKDGSEVSLCTITTTAADAPWGGHLLYTQATREGVTVPDFVWPVFERHKL